jgi:hypothetical protein
MDRNKPGIVMHTCNASFSGGGDQKDQVKVSQGKKLVRPPNFKTSQVLWSTAMWEAEVKNCSPRLTLGKM